LWVDDSRQGLPVVAILGGEKKGMEIFNPRTSTTKLLWDEIPPEKGGLGGLVYVEMVTVRDGEEFILYGDSNKTSNIWKYNAFRNVWRR